MPERLLGWREGDWHPVTVRTPLSQQLLGHLQAQKFLHPGDRIGVAVSGGADSVALLFLLLELRKELGIVLSVVHFNHKLRGPASNTDEKFVAELAKLLKLEFFCTSAQVRKEARKKRANLEAMGRDARYRYFRLLAEQGKITRVAVAHTADDQAETVLAHILRGTGLAGLGGIHPVAHSIFRPLLPFRRSALRAYLRQRKQKWREDATNQDTTRMRARIRKRLIPLLEKQFQPAVVEHLATLADLAREDESFLDARAGERMAASVRKRDGEARIALVDLSLSEPLSQRIVRGIVEGLKQPGVQLGSKHVAAALSLARDGQAGQSLALPGALEVLRERDALVFRARANPNSAAASGPPSEFSYNLGLSTTQVVPVPKLRCVFRFRVIDWPSQRGETTYGETVLDRDRLRLPLILRNWRPGDRLHPLGHHNAHKLKRLLNEKRVSRWEREGWPVLTSDGILAWARGFAGAAEFAATEKTRVGFVIAEEPI